MHAKVILDVDVNFEESTYIKETFIEQYKLRELSLTPVREEITGDNEEVNLSVQTVDQIVHEQVKNIESNSYNANTLLEIYNNL
jgi:hypothetical protein